MTAIGEDIVITIGGTVYTTDINEYSEEGGERLYEMIKAFNNNYKRVEYGRSDYSVTFNFKIESTTLNTLYEITSPITISLGIGSEQTVTYYNMLPSNLNIKSTTNDIAYGAITYSAPAYDKDNTRYNRVIS